jgi:hypothetical protein
MNIATAFPSNFLKAAELEGDTVYTIERVEMQNVAAKGQPDEMKPTLYFQETERGLVLNKTNSATITSLYGPETDDWSGKPITLFSTEVDFQGKQTLAIRVRMKKPAAAPASSAKPAATVSGGVTGNQRTKAWVAFCNATPNKTDAEKAPMWNDLIATEFKGRAEKMLTKAEWEQLAQDIEGGYSEELGGIIPV